MTANLVREDPMSAEFFGNAVNGSDQSKPAMTTALADLADLLGGRLASAITHRANILIGLAQYGDQFAVRLHVAGMLDVCAHHRAAPVSTLLLNTGGKLLMTLSLCRASAEPVVNMLTNQQERLKKIPAAGFHPSPGPTQESAGAMLECRHRSTL